MKRSWKAVLLCLALAASGCGHNDTPAPIDNGNGGDNGGGDNGGDTGLHGSGPAMLLGVEGTNLMQFKAGAPGTILNEEPLTGYAGEGTSSPPAVIDIDFRANGVLYLLMSDDNLYTVDPGNGHVTLVAQLLGGAATLRMFNWDPNLDRIRAIGENNTNFLFMPDGSLAEQDTNLQYAPSDSHSGASPDVEALAYTNSNSAQLTTAYGFDSAQQTLVTIGSTGGSTPASTGQVFTVHALSSNVLQANMRTPFDIETVGTDPAGYMTVFDGTATHLFQVNLSTGALGDLGPVGHNRELRAIAVIPGTAGVEPGSTNGGAGGDELCTNPINGAGTTVKAGEAPVNCLSCTVLNPQNLIDTNPANFARFQYSVGILLAGIDVTVTAAPGTVYPVGDIAGAVLAFPANSPTEVTVAPDVTITTLLAGEVQETTTLGGDTLILDLGGAINTGDKFFAGFATTKPFDAVRILPSDGVIGSLTQLDMYSACASAPSAGAFP